MARGALQVGRVGGVELRLHWTLPVGLVLFSGGRWDPVGWACFVALVVVHELGHAAVVKAVGATPQAIEVSGLGGWCSWRGEVSELAQAGIAWGGVAAQLVLLAGALAWEAIFGAPRGAVGWAVLQFLLVQNTWLVLLNLLPVPPLDGAEAWRWPVLLGRRMRRGAPPHANSAEEDFQPGAAPPEVKALVSSLLDDARKDLEK